VRLLARPRGVEHLASLIKKGAFSSAVDVMEPTQAAATACMAVVGCAIEVTKVSDRSMALANNLGFFKAADKVTVEGRAALETAATAASVNEAAVRAMGRLNSLGDLARDDDEVLFTTMLLNTPSSSSPLKFHYHTTRQIVFGGYFIERYFCLCYPTQCVPVVFTHVCLLHLISPHL